MIEIMEMIETGGMFTVAGVLLYSQVTLIPKLTSSLEHLSTVLDERLPKGSD